jgi:hypothetical protein
MDTSIDQSSRSAFVATRDFLLAHRNDQATAAWDFRWPLLEHFNFAYVQRQCILVA